MSAPPGRRLAAPRPLRAFSLSYLRCTPDLMGDGARGEGCKAGIECRARGERGAARIVVVVECEGAVDGDIPTRAPNRGVVSEIRYDVYVNTPPTYVIAYTHPSG